MKKISVSIIAFGMFASVGATSSSATDIHYTYDDAGRLIKADYGGGKSITYTYDKGGNLLKEDVIVKTAPVVGDLTPSALTSEAGVAQSLSAVYSDSNGYKDLKNVDLLVTKTGTTANAILARYILFTDTLYLYDNAGTAYVGNCRPGESTTLQNGQGALNCATSSVSGSGNTLTVTWSITPKEAFASASQARTVKMRAVDKANMKSGWGVTGSWTITP